MGWTRWGGVWSLRTNRPCVALPVLRLQGPRPSCRPSRGSGSSGPTAPGPAGSRGSWQAQLLLSDFRPPAELASRFPALPVLCRAGESCFRRTLGPFVSLGLRRGRRDACPFSATSGCSLCRSKEKVLYEGETPKSRETEEETKESSSSSSEEEGEDEASESEAEKEAGNAGAPAGALCLGAGCARPSESPAPCRRPASGPGAGAWQREPCAELEPRSCSLRARGACSGLGPRSGPAVATRWETGLGGTGGGAGPEFMVASLFPDLGCGGARMRHYCSLGPAPLRSGFAVWVLPTEGQHRLPSCVCLRARGRSPGRWAASGSSENVGPAELQCQDHVCSPRAGPTRSENARTEPLSVSAQLSRAVFTECARRGRCAPARRPHSPPPWLMPLPCSSPGPPSALRLPAV